LFLCLPSTDALDRVVQLLDNVILPPFSPPGIHDASRPGILLYDLRVEDSHVSLFSYLAGPSSPYCSTMLVQ